MPPPTVCFPRVLVHDASDPYQLLWFLWSVHPPFKGDPISIVHEHMIIRIASPLAALDGETHAPHSLENAPILGPWCRMHSGDFMVRPTPPPMIR